VQEDIDRLRKRINHLDEQLLALLNERAQTALQVGKAKAHEHREVYDPMRERAVLERLASLNTGPLSKGAVEEVFTSIIAACREIQIR
jgi:chorismate mutase-like protein